MNRLRLASVVAVVALFPFDRGGEFRRAWADDKAAASVDEAVGADLDPWSDADGLSRRSVIPGVLPSKSSAGRGPARERGWSSRRASRRTGFTTIPVSGTGTTWPAELVSSSWSTPRKASRQPAFDHQKLAAALTKAAGGEVYRADKLPFESFRFDPDARSIRFDAGKDAWKCSLDNYECSKLDNAAKRACGR